MSRYIATRAIRGANALVTDLALAPTGPSGGVAGGGLTDGGVRFWGFFIRFGRFTRHLVEQRGGQKHCGDAVVLQVFSQVRGGKRNGLGNDDQRVVSGFRADAQL